MKTSFRAYLELWTHAFDFNGCSTRSEYWWATFWNIAVMVVLYALMGHNQTFGAVLSIYYILEILPSWALLVRRLHDAGHSGWCILWNFVPVIGDILIFIYTIEATQDNTPYHNHLVIKHGPKRV